MTGNNIKSMESIRFQNGVERKPSEIIEIALGELGSKSANTRKIYTNAITEFLKYATGKSMEEITWEEIERIGYEETLSYRDHLKSLFRTDDKRKRVNSNSTINNKLASIGSVFSEIGRMTNGRIKRESVAVRKLPEYEKEERAWGSLTEDEVQGLLDYCINLPVRQKPYMKMVFFETAFVTAIRVGALLDLKWRHITQKEINGKLIWTIAIRDKGKKDVTPIPDELYDKIRKLKFLEHKDERGNDVKFDKQNDRVFYTAQKSLAKALKEYCISVGIDYKKRNIVLHSLKKASVDKVYQETRDINVTARHAHHNKIDLIYQTYEGKNSNLLDKPSYAVFGNMDKDVSDLAELSKEELLQAIKNCSIATILEVRKESEKLDRGEKCESE